MTLYVIAVKLSACLPPALVFFAFVTSARAHADGVPESADDVQPYTGMAFELAWARSPLNDMRPELLIGGGSKDLLYGLSFAAGGGLVENTRRLVEVGLGLRFGLARSGCAEMVGTLDARAAFVREPADSPTDDELGVVAAVGWGLRVWVNRQLAAGVLGRLVVGPRLTTAPVNPSGETTSETNLQVGGVLSVLALF